ncbi:MAG: hypothetical protein ACXVPN_00695 [Bacteroidia bacterium]
MIKIIMFLLTKMIIAKTLADVCHLLNFMKAKDPFFTVRQWSFFIAAPAGYEWTGPVSTSVPVLSRVKNPKYRVGNN